MPIPEITLSEELTIPEAFDWPFPDRVVEIEGCYQRHSGDEDTVIFYVKYGTDELRYREELGVSHPWREILNHVKFINAPGADDEIDRLLTHAAYEEYERQREDWNTPD